MQKVITINLNGNAYQLDESGYGALRAVPGGCLAGSLREQSRSRRDRVGSRTGDCRKVSEVPGPQQDGGSPPVKSSKSCGKWDPIDAAAGGEASPGAEGDGKTRSGAAAPSGW